MTNSHTFQAMNDKNTCKDKTGILDHKEFYEALKMFMPSARECNAMIERYDMEEKELHDAVRGGPYTFDQIEEILLKDGNDWFSAEESDMRDQFRIFDAGKKGAISKEHLIELLEKVSRLAEVKIMEHSINTFKGENDEDCGLVDEDAFLDFVQLLNTEFQLRFSGE